VIVLGICLGAAAPHLAGSIGLAWTPVPGATGYRVYHGSSARDYDLAIDFGPSAQATVHGLDACAERFLAVKTYGPDGESEDFSEEVSAWPYPEIHALSLAVVRQGEQVTVEIDGANFRPGAEVILHGSPEDIFGAPLVRVDSVHTLSCVQIQALLTVAPSGPGFRAMQVSEFAFDLEVRNPDTMFGTEAISISVVLEERRLDIDSSDPATQGRVDGDDLAALARAFADSEGGPFYDPDADIDGDGRVDGADLAILARYFGGCWSGTTWADCDES
jgi:hypothetical protein